MIKKELKKIDILKYLFKKETHLNTVIYKYIINKKKISQ